jgi:HEPN domain-containing protein
VNDQKGRLSTIDWLKVAKKDWDRVRYMLEKKDAEAASFFLQQCLEKYLKAFLLGHGWKLRKIHEIDALLDDAIIYDSTLKSFYDLCERVSGYYFADRYPPLRTTDITCEDITKDLEEAHKFITALFPEEGLDV